MRLVTYDRRDLAEPRPGILLDDGVADLADLLDDAPDSVVAALDRLGEIAAALERSEGSVPRHEGFRLHAPLTPRSVIVTGAAYRSHVEEMGVAPPAMPTANLIKLPDSVCGPSDDIVLPPGNSVDYEGEIAIVIGSPDASVSRAGATPPIAGLCLANDVTARDAPMTHLVLAKGAPGFCPLGPALVTLDELDLTDIEFTVTVDGDTRQLGHTDDLLFPLREIAAQFDTVFPLQPGDVILTGSPAGVGVALDPPRFLEPGATVVVESPQLGRLANRFVAASGSTRRIRGSEHE